MDLFAAIVPARTLGIKVESFDNGRIQISAPLEKNINDKGTGFAGSISSMLSLAGWGAVTASLPDYDVAAADVMIVTSEIQYVAAVRGDMRAMAEVSADELKRIVQELSECGRSRISIKAELESEERRCATMSADYAVIKRSA